MNTQQPSKLMQMALDMVNKEFQQRMMEVVFAALQEAHLPPGTRFDANMRLWVLPPTPEAAPTPVAEVVEAGAEGSPK